MKLTVTQLRRIIKEEVSKASYKRTPYYHYLDAMLDSVYFDGGKRYQRKLDAMLHSIEYDYREVLTNSKINMRSMTQAEKKAWIDQVMLASVSMDKQIENIMRRIDVLLVDDAASAVIIAATRKNVISIIDDVEKKLFNGEFAKADVDIDLDSLNTKLDTEEQKEFLENLSAMNSNQLASQYSDISKEMNGRRSMVSPGTPDKEVIKMILDTAYPELDLYGA